MDARESDRDGALMLNATSVKNQVEVLESLQKKRNV